MDDFILVLKDLQPAALIVGAIGAIALISNRLFPMAGPWAGLLALIGVTAHVADRVRTVDPRPGWLLPLGAAGLLLAVIAGYRIYHAIHATANNDRTIGYVFPTGAAVLCLWLSIALIEFDASKLTAAGG